MVQRNVADKLGIQDNRVQSEIRFANLKPSSWQCQDIKNKGGVDLKKKMKISGSVKRMEFENQYRSPKLPNYMKSTTSSVARKEQSQVSTKSPPTSRVSSDLHGKKLNHPSKLSADSRNKAAKTLVRTNSLKMKWNLIKTRALVKKCPKVVLCEDSDIARSTCSSTLKDYKLPDYLVLDPGGTESEGTSVIKVCPYTYCSLNGHLHDPLPPLKSFISTKRLMLKNQRNVQLGCLSPRRARPARNDRKSDEKLMNNGDLGIPTVCHEEPSEFFVEIYSAGEKNTSSTDFMPMVCGLDEIIAQDYEEVEETIPDSDDINFHENLDEERVETDSRDMYHLDAKIPEETSLPLLFQEETKLGNLSIWNDIATESVPSIKQCEQDSESSDVNWEMGRYSALYLDFDYESLSNEEKGNDLDGFKHENGIILDGSQYTYSEDSLNSDSVSSKDDCRSEVSFHYLDGLNSMKTSASIEFPKEEPEAIYEDKDLFFEGNRTPEKIAPVGATVVPSNLMIEEETSFGCLNFECLPNDDVIAVMRNGEDDLLKDVVQKMVTSGDKTISDTIIDVDVSVQTSSDEDLGIPVEENLESLSPTEAEAIIVHHTKEDSSESPTKPDQPAVTNKVGRGILKSNLVLQDQFTGERILIAIAKCKRSIEESEDEGQFNPREPNFLPVEPEPEPEAEKVDPRHQELDEKKNEDSLNLDSVSSKDDCGSEVSFHYLDSLNSMKTSASIEFPKEEPEAIYENKDLFFEGNKTPEKIAPVGATEAPSNLMIEEETSFGCLNFECLPNDDAIAVTRNREADLLKDVVQEMVTSGDKTISDTIIDVDVSVQTSSDEDLGIPVEENLESLSPTEAEAIIVHQTKEDSSEIPTKPGQAAAPYKVGRGILKNNLPLQDQFTGERILIAIAKCKRSIEESDEEGKFNPREPNFLPLEPEPEAEKVDLRHQELDEKKNAEEWMVDYALRQTVTKLGPARMKKVELLVEAFEKVMPITKCELNQSHSSAFDLAKPVQACN